MKYNLYHIKWIDACSYPRQTWNDIEETADDMRPSYVDSVGFLIRKTRLHVTIVHNIDEHGHHSGEICIPRGCIVKYRLIEYV